MNKHTPGPWSAYIDRRSKTIAVDIGATPNGVTPNIVNWPGFDGCGLPLSQQIANAKLIAAAPDLLAAIQVLLDMDISYRRGPVVEAAVQSARMAVKKATGKG